MQPDARGDGRQFLKLCGVFVVTLALCHTDPHVGGVKQTKIIIFYEEPERYQRPACGVLYVTAEDYYYY